MPELLLELFSEEIPARFQRRAAEDLKKAVTDALVEAGLIYEGARAYVTPRRLALTVTGIPARSPDTHEERKGPKVGAPPQAVDGFLRAAGLSSIDEAKIESDPKRGDFYVAHVHRHGADAESLLSAILPKIVAGFSWAKSMRWGAGSMNWVRPLRAITATFGTENDEPAVIPFAADGLASGQTTYGHRFLAPEPIRVKRFDDYVTALERANVVLDLDRRKDIIRADADNLAFAQGLKIIEDAGLLEEVAGLVEWPVVMMGAFDPKFLELPEEVIIATIRANQKCFCLRDASGRLAPNFIITANTVAADGGATIVAGNERVIRARLSDAMFFYNHDLATPLADGIPKLREMVFHAKLGTQFERVERLIKLAGEIAPLVGADVEEAKRAASLAKADLVTGMVGEFPELQGLMGRYYALAQGESPAVANAIRDHYKPLGPTDYVPSEPVAIAVALADKLDLLTGFWAIDEKPTGSRDPFALRRAALGVIRIVTDNGLRLPLSSLVIGHHPSLYRVEAFLQRLLTRDEDGVFSYPEFWDQFNGSYDERTDEVRYDWEDVTFDRDQDIWIYPKVILPGDPEAILFAQKMTVGGEPGFDKTNEIAEKSYRMNSAVSVSSDLLAFFHDRLKVSLRDAGARHDLVDAVISPDSDDILEITQRVEALSRLLGSEDGANLLAGYRRAVNIVVAEEKKDGRTYSGAVETASLRQPEEVVLAEAAEAAAEVVTDNLAQDDYAAAVAALSALRTPVDNFFEKVLVNDPDAEVRVNRLNLLARLRDTMHMVADFGKIAGA